MANLKAKQWSLIGTFGEIRRVFTGTSVICYDVKVTGTGVRLGRQSKLEIPCGIPRFTHADAGTGAREVTDGVRHVLLALPRVEQLSPKTPK